MSLIKKILKEDTVTGDVVKDTIEYIMGELDYDYHKLLHNDSYKLSGTGKDAFVFEIPNTKKVIRIYESEDDIITDLYKELIDKDFDHVVKVYMSKNIGSNTHIQVMEKLKPIKYEKDILINLEDNIGREYVYHEYHETLALEDEYFDELMSVEDILLDVQRGLEELESIGIYHSDMWHENIMKDPITGNYKIIDIT